MQLRLGVLLSGLAVLMTGCLNSPTPGQSDNATGELITVSITVENLPETVTYNKATTPPDKVEYRWQVTFDLNGDGAIDAGDVALQLVHFKEAGSAPQEASVADFVAQYLTYADSPDGLVGYADSLFNIGRRVDGNTISLTLDKGYHPALKDVSSSTLVNFRTSMYDDVQGAVVHDHFPSNGGTVNISSGNFTDTVDDVTVDPMINMVSMTISY